MEIDRMTRCGCTALIAALTVCLPVTAAMAQEPQTQDKQAPEKLENWQDPSVVDRQTEPPRVISTPFPDAASALRGDREALPTRQSLDGPWRFLLSPDPGSRPMEFFDPEVDVESWDEVTVPSSWHHAGFGAQADDPENSENNAVGSYRREFTLPEAWQGRTIMLRFFGVDSAFYVWVNGKNVGFSQAGRLPREFNITRQVQEGTNVVAVAVYQRSGTSDVGCPDSPASAGIVGSVELAALADLHIRDFDVQTELDETYTDARLQLGVRVKSFVRPRTPVRLEAELLDAEGEAVLGTLAGETTVPGFTDVGIGITVSVPEPLKWSAETPNLYTLVMTLLRETGEVVEVVSARIGFRSTEMREGQLLINGVAVQLQGVGHHLHGFLTGPQPTTESMTEEIERIKADGFNAVRLSRHPAPYEWYEIADRHGLYVIDEAGISLHGGAERVGALASQPEWQPALIARTRGMVERGKNHPSIVAWSLGDGEGEGANLDATRKWVELRDPSRPVLSDVEFDWASLPPE